jgi:hypothetical protein
MQYLQQILFVLLAISAIYIFTKKVGEIRRNIFLGKKLDLSDNAAIRWKNLLLLALGQKKMFKNIPVALMHFIIYAGFIIINIEVLEIVLDGILGTHRLFLPVLSGLYNWLINIFEFLALGVLVVCVIFLARRNWLKIKRFVSKDLNGWPRTDANFILVTEIVLMSLFLIMNATDQILQDRGQAHYANTGGFLISAQMIPLFEGFSSNYFSRD